MHRFLIRVSLLKETEQGKGVIKSNKATAVRLLAMGLSVEQIAQATSLTVEEVEELKKSA